MKYTIIHVKILFLQLLISKIKSYHLYQIWTTLAQNLNLKYPELPQTTLVMNYHQI